MLAPHCGRSDTDFRVKQYSRASTQVGNSLILYIEQGSGKVIAGSIEQISAHESDLEFRVRRQAPLPAGKNDPFKRFPDFPAKTYSSAMSTQVDIIHPKSIIGHYARFKFSDERTVVVDLSKVSQVSFWSTLVVNEG